MSSPSHPPSDKEPQSAQPAPDKSGRDAATDVEIQRRFNELRRELLEHRGKLVDRWLAVTAGFLTLLGVIAVIAGYLSFQEFRDIETEARQHMEVAEKHAMRAESVIKEIEATHNEAQTLLKGMNAETVHNDPDQASEVVETVQQSPVASPIDRAIAAAISLQQRGKGEEAIAKWRSIANVVEGVDSQLQARAWFSVGYLYGEEDNLKAEIDAYDKALGLKPDYAAAYNNRGYARADLGQYEVALADSDKALELEPDMAEAYDTRGVAKAGLGQHEAALADYDEAIRLKPDMADVYNNRGITKENLGRLNEAREDYQKALALAQESGDEDLIAKVKRNLSRLDKGEAP